MRYLATGILLPHCIQPFMKIIKPFLRYGHLIPAYLKIFYSGYLDNEKEYGDHRGVLAQPVSSLPANCYSVSCLPWIDFQHFSLHSYENKPYYFPTIEGGKFTANEDKITMPISISVHHATTDGWHVKCFLDELQALMNEPLKWLY